VDFTILDNRVRPKTEDLILNVGSKPRKRPSVPNMQRVLPFSKVREGNGC
jgi:hypothetical protein